MNVPIPPEFEALIRRKLATGRYKNAGEVVLEGMRLLAAQDDWKSDVRRKVGEGVNEMRAAKVVDGEKAVDEVVRTLRRPRRSS